MPAATRAKKTAPATDAAKPTTEGLSASTTSKPAKPAKPPKAPTKASRKAAEKPLKTQVKNPVPQAPGKEAARPEKAQGKPVAKAPPKAKAKEQPPVVDKAAKLKDKLVRDSFTMPASDVALIDTLKERALGFRRPTKKSELLRAGLHALAALSADQLQAALGALQPLKTGRPKKSD